MDVLKPTRKSLPLTERDLADLSTLRGSPEHLAALADATGTELETGASEAALLHAVWEAGMRSVREHLEDAAYAEMAANPDPDFDPVERYAVARRHRPTWAEES